MLNVPECPFSSCPSLGSDLIDAEARPRIAADSGAGPAEVERFLAAFGRMRTLMRRMARMSLWQRLKLMLGFVSIPEKGGRTRRWG